MPKVQLDVDELDLAKDEKIWLRIGESSICVHGNGRVQFIDEGRLVVELDLLKLAKKVTDEGWHPGDDFILYRASGES